MPWIPVEDPEPEKPQWQPAGSVKGPPGPTGPQGPAGSVGSLDEDVPDLTLIFENGIL